MKNFSTLETIRKMRRDQQIIWVADTETTGFKVVNKMDGNGVIDPENEGDRMVEFGATKVIVHCDDYDEFSHYEITDERIDWIFNPERPSDAIKIHGLNDEILSRFPTFREKADDFINLVSGNVLIFHNAPFDVKFIDNELYRVGLGKLTEYCDVFDTLFYAKNKISAKSVSLDALAEKFSVSNLRSTYSSGDDIELINERRATAGRQDVHSADIDALLLAHVFKELTKGVNDLHLGVKISAIPTLIQSDQKRALDNDIVNKIPVIINSEKIDSDHKKTLVNIGAIDKEEVEIENEQEEYDYIDDQSFNM